MGLEDQETIKRNVDKLMRERGWSIAETAKRAGLKNSTLYNARGSAPIGADALIKLAKAFDVTVEELMGEESGKDSVAFLSVEEQDALMYLRRLSPSKRKSAVRILREVVDQLQDSEESSSTASPAPSTAPPKARAA